MKAIVKHKAKKISVEIIPSRNPPLKRLQRNQKIIEASSETLIPFSIYFSGFDLMPAFLNLFSSLFLRLPIIHFTKKFLHCPFHFRLPFKPFFPFFKLFFQQSIAASECVCHFFRQFYAVIHFYHFPFFK